VHTAPIGSVGASRREAPGFGRDIVANPLISLEPVSTLTRSGVDVVTRRARSPAGGRHELGSDPG
jgi:hypothetical protein